MIYQLTYYRHDKKITEIKPVKADTMAKAVQRLIEVAKNHNTEISKIMIKIDGTGTYIEVCDKCQSIIAIKNFLCRECKK